MLRWMDGLEQYGNIARMTEGVGGAAAWSEVGAAFSLSTSDPATGTYHLHHTSGDTGQVIRRAIGQSVQVAGVGYRFSLEDLPGAEPLGDNGGFGLEMISFRDVSNSYQNFVTMGTEGSLIFRRGSSDIDRSEPCVAAGGYHHFEAKTKIANSGGYVELRINEVTVLNLTGLDTQTTANAETSQVAVGRRGSVLTGDIGFGSMEIDDIFCWDDVATDPENTIVDFVGDKGCYYLPTDQDTGENDWSIVGAATAHAALSEVPPDTADYISDTTGAARAVVKVAALPANVSEVLAVMPVLYARKEESGTVELVGGVAVGSAETYGDVNSPSTSFGYMGPFPKTIDPSTGAPWTNDADPDLVILRTA